MRRSDRKRSDGLDPQRILTAAVEAFLDGEPGVRPVDADASHPRHRVSRGAVALGVAIGIGAHALYRRARELDLEDAARTVERHLVN